MDEQVQLVIALRGGNYVTLLGTRDLMRATIHLWSEWNANGYERFPRSLVGNDDVKVLMADISSMQIVA